MSHLTQEQRYTIANMKQQGYQKNQIATTIGKDKSVVIRELRRNQDCSRLFSKTITADNGKEIAAH